MIMSPMIRDDAIKKLVYGDLFHVTLKITVLPIDPKQLKTGRKDNGMVFARLEPIDRCKSSILVKFQLYAKFSTGCLAKFHFIIP